MKTVVLTDKDLMEAEMPEGYTYWSEEARRIWLASKGIVAPYQRSSDPIRRTHTFVMPDAEE